MLRCSGLSRLSHSRHFWGLQWIATEGVERSSDCHRTARAAAALGFRGRPPSTAEVVAPFTVAYVELVPHDREEHRVRTVQQLAVLDRVESDIEGDVGRTAAVPARAVTRFGVFH